MLTPVKLTRVHFPGYEAISDIHDIAAAVIVPKGYRTLATSGHVGVDQYGNLAGTLEEQIRITFENIEKSILAAAPDLTKQDAWHSIYQITTYHKGGVGPEVINAMFDVASKTLGDHAPAWTAIGVEDLAFGRFEMNVLAAIP